jgi:2-polyprenyl-3-methyl-5-hydroxy-6-metoxy-1,4-benzoquinol methylase
MPKGIVNRAIDKLVRILTDKLPDNRLHDLLFEIAKKRAESLPPADGLRFLFRLDALLYPLEGMLSAAYDNGLHTKHRHTKYHDFFTAGIKPGDRVIDIGCGNGALTLDMAKAGACVVGIDSNPDQIKIAMEKHPHENARYVVGDALTYIFQGRFDKAVLSNVLEHIERRTELLARIVDRFNPSRILLRVPVFERDWRVPLKKELGVEYLLDPTHCTEYTLEEFAREMDEAGLEILHQEVRWGEIWAETAPKVHKSA